MKTSRMIPMSMAHVDLDMLPDVQPGERDTGKTISSVLRHLWYDLRQQWRGIRTQSREWERTHPHASDEEVHEAVVRIGAEAEKVAKLQVNFWEELQREMDPPEPRTFTIRKGGKVVISREIPQIAHAEAWLWPKYDDER